MDGVRHSRGVMRRVLADIGIGLIGMLLMLFLWHAYTDHLAFHAIVGFINEHADQIKKLP